MRQPEYLRKNMNLKLKRRVAQNPCYKHTTIEMKANELRTGNLVFADLYEDKHILVESICSKNNDIFNSTAGDIPIHSIRPIPLTEELILRFHAIKTGSNYHVGVLTLWKNINDGFYYFRYDGFAEKIDFVHKLQNLYFALTQTELTLS